MNTGETIALIKAFGNGGGGSSLPAVTSSDNGKVLAVKDGAWAADANTFVITASGSPKTIDKTVAEILAALDAGKAVYLVDGSRTYAYLGKDSTNIYVAAEGYTTNRYYAYIALSNAKYTESSYPKLPSVYASDNGSELIVKNGYWAKQQKKFIVTLTPTALDYSGTMDKTVAEINAAYEAGMEIVFRFMSGPSVFYEIKSTVVYEAGTNYKYPSFEGCMVEDTLNALVYAKTGHTDDGTQQTYSTIIYALTPAS